MPARPPSSIQITASPPRVVAFLSQILLSETDLRLKVKFAGRCLSGSSHGETHHVAHQAKRRPLQVRAHRLAFDGGERADDAALAVGGAIVDESDRRRRRQTMRDELACDDGQRACTHVNDDSLAWSRQHRPVEIDTAVPEMPRYEDAGF